MSTPDPRGHRPPLSPDALRVSHYVMSKRLLGHDVLDALERYEDARDALHELEPVRNDAGRLLALSLGNGHDEAASVLARQLADRVRDQAPHPGVLRELLGLELCAAIEQYDGDSGRVVALLLLDRWHRILRNAPDDEVFP